MCIDNDNDCNDNLHQVYNGVRHPMYGQEPNMQGSMAKYVWIFSNKVNCRYGQSSSHGLPTNVWFAKFAMFCLEIVLIAPDGCSHPQSTATAWQR